MKFAQYKIKKIFNQMYSAIGGESNSDIKTYRNRETVITRDAFFREAVWAIWSGGKSRVSNDAFLNRALKNGFVYDFQIIASWNDTQQNQFLDRLHGFVIIKGIPRHRVVPNGAKGRWNSIFYIAKVLAKCTGDKEFQDTYFNGKTASASLGEEDIQRLISLRIPYLKDATAHFLVRNMGAEAIKQDRWVLECLRYYHLSIIDLEKLLIDLGIPFGLFDAVLWCYCELFIGDVSKFEDHCSKHFPQ